MEAGGARGEGPPLRLPLRRLVAGDVFGGAAPMLAGCPAPGAACAVERAALGDVGRIRVRVASLARIPGTWIDVTPVRPGPERRGADRRDPEIVAREGHRPVGELLVVRVGLHVRHL